MLSTDWSFDFESLPRWDNHNHNTFQVYDKYHYLPESDTLCCIYSIMEASMCNYIGFLAVLKNKSNPKLILNIAEGFNFCDNFSASKDGKLLFLQPTIYYKELNKLLRPILIIDVFDNNFSFISTDNVNTSYKIIEVGTSSFKIEADEFQKNNDDRLAALCKQKIRTDLLSWHDLSKIKSLPEMLRNEIDRQNIYFSL